MTARKTLFWCALTILSALAIVFSLPVQAQTVVHKADLTWSMSPDAVADPTLAITYNVYRANGTCPADGSYPLATASKLAANLTTLSFSDTNVKVGQTYCYAITAVLGSAESGAQPSAGTIPLARIPVTVLTK